jgi:hypothetical protein
MTTAGTVRGTTGHPTRTALENYQIAADGLASELPKLKKLKQLDAAGASPTPGRLIPEVKAGPMDRNRRPAKTPGAIASSEGRGRVSSS